MFGHHELNDTAAVQDTWAALVTIDNDCRIHLFNREAERLTGLDARSMLGQRACEVLWEPRANGNHEHCPWQHVLRGTERRLNPREMTITIGGRRIHILIGARPRRTEDGISGAVITFIDLSYHQAIDQMRADLMAEVFHELRSPICSISMAAHFLSADFERLPADRLRGLINTIQRNAGTLLADLNDLLNRSTFTADQPNITPRPVALDPVIQQAILKLQPLLDERHQRVYRAYDADTLPDVLADERRIEQVLVNLLTNAHKYSVEADEIVVSIAEQDGCLRVEVEDHGPGIEPQERRRVFERFYRTGTTADTVTGAGLGLAIVRRIVEAHGGQVGIEESIPHGARFWFTLPLAAVDHGNEGEKNHPFANVPSHGLMTGANGRRNQH